jgi:hypothetical protein
MKPAAASFGLGSEFDNFLFAPIAEDWNGMSLSVVSLLGRMDLDPWQEAASLAALPAKAAVQRLTSLLTLLPDPPLQQPEPGTIAARLVALLPHRPDPNSSPLQSSGAATTHARAISKGILLAVYLTVMLAATAAQLVVARLGQTRAAAHPPTSVAAPSQTPPPASVK